MAQSIQDTQLVYIKNLYYKDGLSMNEIAQKIGVSIDAVVFFFRKHHLVRRTQKTAQHLRFEKKTLSFTKNKIDTTYLKELSLVGTMLYWAEGYKGDKNSKNFSVDFTNSDHRMITIFLLFLRKIYSINESRLRVLLYCYKDQNIEELITFWSKITKIPKKQFSKPYVRSDAKSNGRKMKYGMVHIRYSDKKLLLDIKNMIELYGQMYA